MSDQKWVVTAEELSPTCMDFHSFEALTEFGSENWMASSEIEAAEEYELASPITRLILALDGVTSVTTSRYTVRVHKGRMHEWKDLAPKIIDILLKWHHHQRWLRGEATEERELQDLTKDAAPPNPSTPTPPVAGLVGSTIKWAIRKWSKEQ